MVGWLGVGALIVTALVTSIPWLKGVPQRGFWLALAGLILLIALYRFLNIEQIVPNELRSIAASKHVYDQRRLPQAMGIAAILIVGYGVGFALVRWRKEVPRKVALGLCLLLVSLYLARLLSLHMIDRLLYARIGPVAINWLFEGAILAAICVAAMVGAREKKGRA